MINAMDQAVPETLIGEAPSGHSSVFFGNISYDLYEQNEEELNRTLRTVGPYRDMKLMFGDDQKPKGFGFCTYNDPDSAASAIRNLNKLAINSRDLKVHFASDKMSGTNLKPEEVSSLGALDIPRGCELGGVPCHPCLNFKGLDGGALSYELLGFGLKVLF